jgi:ABC-type multidrug transport system ATPase subunit
LHDVKNARVVTFSGGMKRRLTVAISCIGDPQIVIMDEPTTGMDPVSRQNVWKLI